LAEALRERTGLRDQVLSIEEIEALDPQDRPKVAILVIDEGQQILSLDRVELVEALVEGGIQEGKWAWFGDPNYQAATGYEGASSGLGIFVRAATVRPRLSRNCRNTPEIITAAELASGVALGHATVSGRGFHPSLSAADAGDAGAGAVVRQINDWLGQDIPLRSMTLLTNGPDVDDLAVAVARLGGFPVAPWTAKAALVESLAYSPIESFRGLESGFVVLCITGTCPTAEELGRVLYLGMTRGNFALAVIASPPILQAVQEQMAANAVKHLEEQRRGH
jgi:hypothetical protein